MKPPAPWIPLWALLPILAVLSFGIGAGAWGAIRLAEWLALDNLAGIAGALAVWLVGFRIGNAVIRRLRIP